MLKNTRRTWSLALAASTVALGAMAVTVTGCSDDDTVTPTPTADSGTKADTGTTPVTDAGTTSDAATTTLYERLGKRDGIKAALGDIVTEELKDPEIASYFFNQVKNPVPAGHPGVTQLLSCLTNQLSQAAGGPEMYPGTPTDGENAGFQCRSMSASHASLHIPGSVFDKFVTIAAGVLAAKNVPAADIATIGGVLNSTRSSIVDPARDGGAYNGDGG